MVEESGYFTSCCSRENVWFGIRGRGGAQLIHLMSRRVLNGPALPWGEDHELYSALRENVNDITVDCGFRQPHALRHSAEAVDEVLNSPFDLALCVADPVEGEDRVVVPHGHAVAVAETPDAFPVSFHYHVVENGVLVLEPRHDRVSEVEGKITVVVGQAFDPSVRSEISGKGVCAVTFMADALIPVVKGSSARLLFDYSCIWVFPGGLIKVSM